MKIGKIKLSLDMLNSKLNVYGKLMNSFLIVSVHSYLLIQLKLFAIKRISWSKSNFEFALVKLTLNLTKKNTFKFSFQPNSI